MNVIQVIYNYLKVFDLIILQSNLLLRFIV